MTLDPLPWATLGTLAVIHATELPWSAANFRRLLAQGGREFDRGHYLVIVASVASIFLATALEVALAPWAGQHAATLPFLGLVALALVLRFWVQAALGRRWTTRIIVVPGESPILRGPYRFLRHPNYVSVAFELVGVALAFAAFATAAVFAPILGWVLAHRIRSEEAAWRSVAARPLGTRPRAGRA